MLKALKKRLKVKARGEDSIFAARCRIRMRLLRW